MFYVAIKKDEIMVYVKKMDGTTVTILSEISQTQKDKHLSYMGNLDLKFYVLIW